MNHSPDPSAESHIQTITVYLLQGFQASERGPGALFHPTISLCTSLCSLSVAQGLKTSGFPIQADPNARVSKETR